VQPVTALSAGHCAHAARTAPVNQANPDNTMQDFEHLPSTPVFCVTQVHVEKISHQQNLFSTRF
jgi:hypothetical protein